jgi:hypothetical protein
MYTSAVHAAVLVACLASVFACGKSANPSAPSGVPDVVGLTIAGPAEVSLGRATAFTATAEYADGTKREVTADALWATVDTAVATAGLGGQVTGVQRGETAVQAYFKGRFATRPVLALPEGTFLLTLTVVDAVFQDLSIPDASAEIETADGTAPRAVRAGTSFKFYGVRGRVRVRVTAPPSFEPAVEEIDVLAHQTAKVAVPLAFYTVTITASPFCTRPLPEVVKSRTYQARVSRESFPSIGFPKGGQFLLRLEGDTFHREQGYLGNAVVAEMQSDGTLRFEFMDPYVWDFTPYFLQDDLSDPDWTRYLPHGSGVATPTVSGLAGRWRGTIGIAGRRGTASASCNAGDHEFTIVAR